jgi:Mn-dependent DtxR family transcriptional regulator
MVNLSLMKDFNISFVEAGLLERIRYFAEFDPNGSGWCYVGKERLADELGLTRKTIYNMVNSLIDRGFIEKNDKGWMKTDLEGVKNLHSVKFTQSVKNLHKDCVKITHNNILEDNTNLSNSNNDSSMSVKITHPEKELHSEKNTLPAKEQYWNGCRIGSKVPKRKHCIMPIEQYVKYQTDRNRRPCTKFDAPLVWLSTEEFYKLVDEYKSETFAIEMIKEMNKWKESKKQGMQTNLDDFRAIDMAWVARNANTSLQIKTGTTVDKLRKQEAMKAEIQKNMGGISFEQ